MNNCKNNNEQLEELKKMGLDGLYELVLDQQKQIDRLFGALGMYLNGNIGEAERILWEELK